MAEDSFLLVNLKEEKSKKLAQVLSNDSSRKILDFLSSKKSATETEIAGNLKIPLSTAHYNIRQLMHANIIEAEEFHYSEKGKEVNHYRLANKMIIIMPREDTKFVDRLKKLIPAAFFVCVSSIGVYLIQNASRTGAVLSEAGPSVQYVAKAADVSSSIMSTGVSTQAVSSPNFALWFLIGGMAALAVYFVWDQLSEKKKH